MPRIAKCCRATLAVLICATALTACNGAHSDGTAASSRLRLVKLAVSSGGDEHDEIGASDNGRFWVIGRYATNRVVLVDTRTGSIRSVPGVERESGNPYEVTDGGLVEVDPDRAAYPDLALDRTDGGARLFAVQSSVFLSSPGGEARQVATGFPRLGPELSGSFSAGAISDSGYVVTLMTTRAYDPADRNDSVDVYQFDLRSGAKTWVSRADSAGGGGVAASASGRYVVFDGTPAGDVANDHDVRVALRWDRESGNTEAVSLNGNGRPGRHGVTGDFSVTDDGRVAFVSYDCNLTAAAPPKDASSCLYVSAPG